MVEPDATKTVLVVDDDDDMLLLCRLQLTGAGLEVRTASDGAAAVAAVRSARPDVVVMDYSLGDMDGPDVVRQIRAVCDVPIPVVMLTARAGIEDQEAAWRVGVSDYVLKPFEPSRLLDAVHAAMTPGNETASRRRSADALDRLRANDVATWRQMATVIEHAEDAIITKTLDGTITTWNAAAERLYGYSEAEAVGQDISMITVEDRVDEEADILERIGRGETVRHFETVRESRDGRRIDISLSVSPVIGADGTVLGAAAIARDVSDRRRDDQRFRDLVEAAPDAMVIVDASGLIELVNAQTENLFGFPRDELVGQPVEVLVPERFRAQHPAHRSGYIKAPRFRPMGEGVELRGLRRDGSEFPIEISLSPIDTEGGTSIAAAIRDVTERKQAETMFRGLLEAAPDAIVGVDAGGQIRLVNAQTEVLTGYSRDELLGKPVEILVPIELRESHPHHRDRYFHEPQTRPMGAGLDLVARRKDGTQVPVEISLSSIETADGRLVSAAIRDVSERAEADAMFRGLVESAPDAMVIVDADGRIQLVNAQTENLFGHDRGDLVGKPVEVLVPQRFRGRHPKHRLGYVGNPRMRPMGAGLDLLGLRQDGTEFPVEISLSPIQTSSGTMVSASIRDVTERAQAEAARGVALDRERQASQRLREIDGLRTDFLSTVSHELRTPLTAIKGFAWMLSDRGDEMPFDDRSHLIERISRSSDRLDYLINDLLDFSRLERGLLRVTPEPHDAQTLVAQVIDRIESAVEQHTLDVRVPQGLTMLVDDTAFSRVLDNLLSNAAKFSDPGSTITVAAAATETTVSISVTDEGEGIDASEVDHVFDRFYRVGGADNRKPGTGVGLAIVKEFTQAQGGTVTIDSKPGHGATFTLTFQRAATD